MRSYKERSNRCAGVVKHLAAAVGGDLETAYTDSDGHAYFTTACDYPTLTSLG